MTDAVSPPPNRTDRRPAPLERGLAASPSSPGRTTLMTFALVIAALVISYAVFSMEALNQLPRALGWLVQPILVVGLVLVGLAWIHKIPFGAGLAELGLRAPFLPALLFALFATLPMAMGFGLADDPVLNLDPLNLFFTLLIWPFVEEVLFIGFAFRQLYRRARWGFFSAALLPPIVFAVLHVTNAFFSDQDLRQPLLAAGLAIVGGLLLAWLFVAWNDNLWVPILFHGLMNFWWEGFGVDRSGIGVAGSDLLRLAAVVLAVLITLGRYRLPLGLHRPGESEAAARSL